MRGPRPTTPARRVALAAAVAVFAIAGCATPQLRADAHYRFFELPDADDVWTPQISSWQARERVISNVDQLRSPAPAEADVSGAGSTAIAPVADGGDLRNQYFSYRAERKRELARGFADWVQRESKSHYIPDGPVDHWATLGETFDRNGDDCDGLELLAFHFLLDLGFRSDEVYRAIIVRPADGQHHMVTLWFEDAADPWVIDPTGAMTTGMPRLSAVPGWVPLKVFSETTEYTVRGDAPLLRNAVSQR